MNNRTSYTSNIVKYLIGDRILDDIIDNYRADYDRHYKMLQNLAASGVERQPILYIRNLPFIDPTPGTSNAMSAAALSRYRDIDSQLTALSESTEDGVPAVEAGAISTARSVVRQLSSRELAPPEIARLSNEAVVMLWAVGNTRYALTVTDGEVGYVVRRAKETVKKKSNLKPTEFDLLRIR